MSDTSSQNSLVSPKVVEQLGLYQLCLKHHSYYDGVRCQRPVHLPNGLCESGDKKWDGNFPRQDTCIDCGIETKRRNIAGDRCSPCLTKHVDHMDMLYPPRGGWGAM